MKELDTRINSVFEKVNFLPIRPRIHAILEQAVKLPLVTVIAGPGYGKTTAVAHSAKKLVSKLAWFFITRLDNIAARFWNNFLRAMEDHFSKNSLEQLNELGFPDTLAKLDIFLHLFAEEIYTDDMLVLVIDDYSNITDPSIHNFFEYLIEAQLENFCMIIISSAYTDVDLAGLRNGGVFQIGTEDLKFTLKETRLLFQHYNIILAEDVLKKIYDDTEGWPLALYLLTHQLRSNPEDYEIHSGQTFELIRKIFGREFFFNYKEEIRHLLVKLSLLHSFTLDVVRRIGGFAPQDIDRLLQDHMFITNEANTNLYSFHATYRAFLNDHLLLIDEAEIERVYRVAGDSFLSQSKVLEAIECYAKCGQYDKILTAIQMQVSTRMGMAPGQASFVLEHLNRLPQDFIEKNPFADYLKALIYMNNVEIDTSYEILMKLEQKLLSDSSPSARAVLGEVYTMLGGIHMLRNREDFGVYYQKACEYLPEGSSVRPKNPLLTENNTNFSMQDNGPGALERMERAVHWGIPYMVQAMNGGCHGLQYLYSAEAAYNTGRLQDAVDFAYKGIYMAKERDQHDLICNAHIILAKTALMRGDFYQAYEHVQLVQKYINDRKLIVLYDLRDTALSWFYLKMDDLKKISSWMTGARRNERNQPPITIGRDRIVIGHYLYRIKSYSELIPFLEWLERILWPRGLWTDRLFVYIMRALTYQKIGQEKLAMDDLWRAYQMSYFNNIVMPFAEAASDMQALISLAKRSSYYTFDTEWLDDVYQKAGQCTKKLRLVRREYQSNQEVVSTDKIALSKREAAVLRSLAQGLTREEIAADQYLSINTIKTYISSIYNKLGAVNRADAIRIASINKMI